MFFFLRFDVNSNIACMGIVKGRSDKGGMGGGWGGIKHQTQLPEMKHKQCSTFFIQGKILA